MDKQLQEFIVNLVSENLSKSFKEKNITSGIQVFEDDITLKWLQMGFFAFAFKNGEQFAASDRTYPITDKNILLALQKNNCELYKELATRIQVKVNNNG